MARNDPHLEVVPDVHASIATEDLADRFDGIDFDPEIDAELLEFSSTSDETSLVVFGVATQHRRRDALSLTTERLTLGDQSVHLVNVVGIGCSSEVPRDAIGDRPRRYVLRLQECGRLVDFSFEDRPASKHVVRAGYEVLMGHLRRGLLPMIHSELERRIDGGGSVMIGALEIAKQGFSVGGLPSTFSFSTYRGCRQQDDLLLVNVADPTMRTVAQVPLAAMNAQLLPALLGDLSLRRPAPPPATA